jgi:hypothetical protein
MGKGKQFPLISTEEERQVGIPLSVPFNWVVQFERQVLKNHLSQTVERLAKRGGLGIEELYAVVNGLTFASAMDDLRGMGLEDMVSWLELQLEEYAKGNPEG